MYSLHMWGRREGGGGKRTRVSKTHGLDTHGISKTVVEKVYSALKYTARIYKIRFNWYSLEYVSTGPWKS